MSSQLLFSLKEAIISYHKNELFNNLDLNIHRKDFIALVGKNGAGKSTLMNVISGVHEIDNGEIWKIDNFSFKYFNQNFQFINENQSIEKEIASSLINLEEEYQIDVFCNYLNINKNLYIKNLSGGQKKRVGLIKTLINKSDLLLLDEPTNHLDLDTIIWLENYLRRLDCAIICVSHDKQFLKNFTNKIFWIDRSKVKINSKGYSDFDLWSQTLLDQEERELQNRKQSVNIEVNWANKGVKARVKRNIRRLDQARELKDNLDKDISAFKQATKKIDIKLVKDENQNFKHVAEFHNAFFYYEDLDKNPIIKDFNFKINKKDRIGLLGPNGSGKSTFLKLLLQELNLKKGSLKIRKELEFSYFDQLRNDLKDNLPIRKILVPSGGDYLKTNGRERHVCSYLKDFHFDPSKSNDPVGSLSGGMKNRLLLSKVLSNPKTGLILDEPTNDLDTDTLDLVESILSQYNGTLIVVSHNRDFLDKLVNKILYFKGNGDVVIFNGGYHDFLSQKEQIISSNTNIDEKRSNVKDSEANSNKSGKKKLTFKLKFELDKIPKEIDMLKNQLEKLEQIISDPSLYEKDNNLFIDTSNKIGSIQLKLQEKEERWLQLMELDEN
ncbi:MAG: ABC transporter ATP-binding protein [alpha proteobacterium HIMB59]|nr:MAG: ABC transporter ATP-binding protein [alpha proteobacterium HIMB59]|tara:strand:- start:936 stop:2762 length:1827 start_codon:yes stop_codon:yes gene_type:complete